MTPFYDSLIAKVIVHARTRELAIARMKRALEAMVIEGIKTTSRCTRRSWTTRASAPGDIGTDFMEYFLARNGRKAAARKSFSRGVKIKLKPEFTCCLCAFA